MIFEDIYFWHKEMKTRGGGNYLKNVIFSAMFEMQYLPKDVSALCEALPTLSAPLKTIHKLYVSWFKRNFDRLIEWRNGRRIRNYQVWHTVFDWSLGVVLDSRSKISEIEKARGMKWVSVSEWEVERKKSQQRREEMHTEKIAKGIESIKRDIAQGRKFTKEKQEYNRRIEQTYGFKIKRRQQP